jgi:hypothetical protein
MLKIGELSCLSQIRIKALHIYKRVWRAGIDGMRERAGAHFAAIFECFAVRYN